MEHVFDVAIVGGGINGCGIAADAAMRGLSVILVEQDDLASKTSSSSSKLIHGGLRYLEYYDFALVKKALDERQRLLDLAPHLVYPLAFVLPYQQAMRPRWLLRTGLFLYDNLSHQNKLPASQAIRRTKQTACFSPLAEQFNKGFLFYDCATDDARLTITNALQAKKYGASIQPHSQLLKAFVQDGYWHLVIKNKLGEEIIIKAKSLINATGPWVTDINQLLHIPIKFNMSLVKGSHLVVHKFYEGNHAYLLQHRDKRIVFVIPYHGFTMIGTTDVAFMGSLNDVNISAEEIEYLCTLINSYFKCQLQKKDIIDTWSGVRPLIAEPGESLRTISRDYAYFYTETPAPAVTIYGGKITTYRQLALEVVNELRHLFPHLQPSQTKTTPLPGATLSNWSYKEYVRHMSETYFWLDETIKERFLTSYGTRSELILSDCSKVADLGYDFGHGLYQVEVDYLMNEEWACSCEDILWRRTKLGFYFSQEEKQVLARYIQVSAKC